MNEQPQISQTAMKDIRADRINASIDQSVGKTVNYSSAPKPNRPIPSNVRRGSSNFVGREVELDAINDALTMGQGAIVCAVEGLGGVGKTELALQYAEKYRFYYAACYWLPIREAGLAIAVIELAGAYLALPEALQGATAEVQAAWYWQNWLPESGQLLVILDDVASSESLPEQAMPLQERVKVLVTTRERALRVGFESVSLDVLSQESCVELLVKIVGKAKVEREPETVAQICDRLGCLPLGVELVGEYLVKNRHLSFVQLQQRLSLAEGALSQERRGKFYGYRGVAAAIQLSWEDLSAGSQRVAMLLGLFAPVDTLWALVEFIAEAAGISTAELEEARGQLDRLHLIQPVDEGCDFYRVHTLVREFFGQKLAAVQETSLAFRRAFVERLLGIAKQMPQTPTRDLIEAVRYAIPHLEHLSREMLEDIPDPEADLAWVFNGIARFYKGQGQYTLALPWYEEYVVVTKERLGETNNYHVGSLNNLAELYRSQGRYSEAEPLYLRSLSISESQLGADHPDVATSLNNLAALYRSQGCYSEAEPLYLRSLSIWESQLGADHPDVATSLNNLASLYKSQGRYSEAEPLFLRSLSITESQLGSNHADVATSLNNLAGLYESQGRYSEANSLYQRALQICEQSLGIAHPNTMTIRANYAQCLKKWSSRPPSQT